VFDEIMNGGRGIAGSPQSVVAADIQDMAGKLGV